ncbi:MAG: AAA family ATPase [Lysobacteraceae bacterium]
MFISQLKIRNFRGLEDIEFSPRDGINVLVGPNAVGKTSILEAIRLTKALLAPRYRDEVSQVLQSLGATTPHMMLNEQQIDFSAIAGTTQKPLEVSFEISLSAQELSILSDSEHQLAQSMVRSRIGQERQSQLDLIQFMSSPQGQEHLRAATSDARQYLNRLKSNPKLSLGLAIEPIGNGLQISSKDTLAQLIIQGLEAACRPQSALLSYFPADRALPSGETGIQLGSADMQQQVFSHLAQPATKYNRLKQIIVNASVLGSDSRLQLEDSFNAIFGQLLPGKKLDAIQQKQTGALSVLIRDEKQNRVFDIDSMSSGEKGLILSFLLLRAGAAAGGIVLLDEPELHLNPAVCARLVPFLHSQVVQPLELQVLLCTHSAEVLTTALHREDCTIFHLRTPKDITPVARRDKAELFEILRRLGLNSMDVVSWQGTLFVEGEDDIDLLSNGFPDLLAGYQIKSLGGRTEVEKDITRLQDAEKRGEVERPSSFIFDRDGKPSSITSSRLVKVLQWDRHCIENYLTDESVLFDVLSRYCNKKPESKGELRSELKRLALSQADEEAIRIAYAKREPENCGIRSKEISSKSAEQAAEILFSRLKRAQEELANIEHDSWVNGFNQECKEIASRLNTEWDDSWRKECNAKKIFKDLQSVYQAKVSTGFLKVEVIKEMRVRQTDDWKILQTLLREAIEPIPSA